MRKLAFILVFLLIMMPVIKTYAARGVVVYYDYLSDKIIVETTLGYTCAEIYGYSGLLDTGDTIAGDLESYGFHEVYNLTKDDSFRIYIDDYWLDRDRALDWLRR